MGDHNRTAEGNDETENASVPMRAEMEERMQAKVVTWDDRGVELPGGMCRCCGSGPDAKPDWREEPWYVYRAGLCDSDGVYYSCLCEGCLEDIRFEYDKRVRKGILTERDEIADQICELMGDDIDGAQTMMDDLDL